MRHAFNSFRMLFLAVLAFALVACDEVPKEEDFEPLGDFKLGYAVVVTTSTQVGPLSRKLPNEDFEASLTNELKRVFGSFEGSRYYHISLSVDGYVLAQPGVPLVLSPKSALIVTLNVWDDAKQKLILDEPKQFTVLEKFAAKNILGSGYTMSAEEQLAELTKSTVKQVYKYLRENENLFKSEDGTPSDT